MTVGVGLGVGLVVGGLGIVPALNARQARQFARTPALAPQETDDAVAASGRAVPGSFLWTSQADRIGERDVIRILIARAGPGPTPLPPGVSHFPGPGEKVLSP
ncbi:MAG TPA: ABC transporter permease, partial [Actinomycetota bacterium]|nr:ABC transporter permease [Actinomycetota bacterium]